MPKELDLISIVLPSISKQVGGEMVKVKSSPSEAQLRAWAKQTCQRRDRLMDEVKKAEDRLLELRLELAKFCVLEGHDYQQQSLCLDERGQYWECDRCGYPAPGRHHTRPDRWLK